jgi:uncharacterized protein with GYD domain
VKLRRTAVALAEAVRRTGIARRRRTMPTYVSLLKFTDKGIQTIKEAPKRVEAAKQIAKAAGAEIKSVYYVLGHYDVVVISEAPDDETAVRMALAGAMPGNVKSETLRAFPAEEFMKIVAKLP